MAQEDRGAHRWGAHAPAEAGIMVPVDRAGWGLSYRGMASRLAGSAGLRRRYGLRYRPSKSTLHAAAAAGAAAKAFMDAVLAGTVSHCREGRLHGDSTGFGLRRYVGWRSAKYGCIPVCVRSVGAVLSGYFRRIWTTRMKYSQKNPVFAKILH